MLALALVVAGAAAHAEPLRLGHATWIDAGPFYIAREKGYFAEEGVEVELVKIEDVKVRAAAMVNGDLEAITAAADTVPLLVKPDVDLVYLFALADSNGADGIVARKEIVTVADLKGRTVAFSDNTTGQFYLNVLLREAGLRQADVEAANLPPGNASRAFARGEVDAAFTWQPHLARAAELDGAHLLTNTSRTPRLIAYMAVAPAGVAALRREEFRALYRAWLRAVEFVRDNPEEADEIMARGVGRWLKSPEVFAKTRADLLYFDGPANSAYFGAPAAPGQLMDTARRAIDIWAGFGRMRKKTVASELIDYGIVRQ